MIGLGVLNFPEQWASENLRKTRGKPMASLTQKSAQTCTIREVLRFLHSLGLVHVELRTLVQGGGAEAGVVPVPSSSLWVP